MHLFLALDLLKVGWLAYHMIAETFYSLLQNYISAISPFWWRGVHLNGGAKLVVSCIFGESLVWVTVLLRIKNLKCAWQGGSEKQIPPDWLRSRLSNVVVFISTKFLRFDLFSNIISIFWVYQINQSKLKLNWKVI